MVGLVLLASAVLSLSSAEPVFSSTELRSEIEDAARDSRQLADDLASMLARLEDTQEVEVEVLQENTEVEEALEEMIRRIENLAENTRSGGRSDASTEELREEEEELHDTLVELENVAKEIEFVAATSDDTSNNAAIEKMALALKEVSDRIKGVEEVAKSSKKSLNNFKKSSAKKNRLGKTAGADKEVDLDNLDNVLANLLDGGSAKSSSSGSSSSSSSDFDLDSIIGRLSTKERTTTERSEASGLTLGGLLKSLSSGRSASGDEDEEESSRSGDLDIDSIIKSVISKESDSEDLTDVVEASSQEPRRPKQLDDGLEDGDSDESADSKSSYKKKEPEPPKETCEDKPQSNRVQVCTPDFQNRDSNLRFYSSKIVNHQYCFNLTRTVCEERSSIITKDVCTYEYLQKEIIAPAHLVEIGFERLYEPFYITKCEKKLVKDGYKEKEVEVCYKENVDVPYRLPTVSERIEDFVELAAPVPEKHCRQIKYDIPEVICQDKVNKECVTLYSLDKDTVDAKVQEVVQSYRGNCDYKELEQTTQVCTIEVEAQRPRYNQYNAYRG